MNDLSNFKVFLVGSITDDAMQALMELKIPLRAFVTQEHKNSNNKKYLGDEIYVLNWDSKEELQKSLNELDLKDTPDVALACLDNYVIQTSWITEYYGILGPNEEAAVTASDKYLSRDKFMRSNPEITPDFIKIESKENLIQFAKSHKFPLVLKPTNLVKSMLVSINHSVEELIQNYNIMLKEIQHMYKKQKVINFEPNIILEEFLDGTMHSVKTFIDNDSKTYSPNIVVDLITAQKIGINDNYLYARRIPSTLPKFEIDSLISVANKAAKSLGLTNIICHTELILTKVGPKIVEINPRMGGYRQQMFLQTSGINLYKELIKMLSGTEPEFSPTKQLFQIRIELLPETKGVFELVTNLSDLKSLKSFKEIVTRKEPGEIVGPATLGFTWVSSINLESNNPKELNEDFMFIMKNVKIKVS